MTEEIHRIRDRLEMPQWLWERGLTGYGAEVGVLFGEFSEHVLENWPGKLLLVDPWQNQPQKIYRDGCNSVVMEEAYEKTLAKVARFGDRAVILRKFSHDAVGGIVDGSLSWAYLDHNHSLEVMRDDLPRYWAKVRPGGLMGGHDFYNRHDDWHDCGVQQAVEEFCAERGLTFYTTGCTSWWVEKPV